MAKKMQTPNRRGHKMSRRRGLAILEALENRTMLSLLGDIAPGYPSVYYDSSARVDYAYDPASNTGMFTSDPTYYPQALQLRLVSGGTTTRIVMPRSIVLNIHLNADGTLATAGSQPGDGNDLIVYGAADTNTSVSGYEYTSPLLTGEILDFGYQAGTSESAFNFRFKITGGSLRSLYTIDGVEDDIGMTMTAPTLSGIQGFTGNFAQAFINGAQGYIGPVAPNIIAPPALPTTLSGYVFADANNDGLRTGDTGLAGVNVTLTGTNANGPITPVTIQTDGTGHYSFTGLSAGTYTVSEDQSTVPATYLDGKDTLGTVNGNVVGTVGSDVLGNIVLNNGDNALEYNFGEILPASISGQVFFDANNDGSAAGDAGIAGVSVTLSGTNDQGTITPITVTTDASGNYSFTGLRPGTYTVSEDQGTVPTTYLDGKDSAGSLGGTTTDDATSGIVVNPGDAGVSYNFGEIKPASVSGFVWADFNNDGLIDFNEQAIGNVTVTLTGTNDLGQSVTFTDTTDADGYYLFSDLRPGTYTVVESQPTAYTSGTDVAGTINGVTVGTATTPLDTIGGVALGAGDQGLDYNFGERPNATGTLGSGMAATIGFWHNKNGQKLITSLNNSAGSTQLGDWLAATFPNLYGGDALTNPNFLGGKTNAQVAAFYLTKFNIKGMKVEAQILATAFAVYATNSTLAGTVAVSYGFKVSTYGTGDVLFNIGTSGAAFNVANNTSITIMDILLATDAKSSNGSVYNGIASMLNLANIVYNGINTGGDIS